MWLLVLAAPHIFPFDLEAYLKHHFTKVGNQTKALVDSFIDAAGKAGTPSGATTALASASVQRYLDGKTPKKIIVVQNRIINVVA